MSKLDLDMVIFENNAEATQDMMDELADLRQQLAASREREAMGQAREQECEIALPDWNVALLR